MGLMNQIDKVVYRLMDKMKVMEEEIGADPDAHQALPESPERVELFEAMMSHGDGSLPLSPGAAPHMMSSMFYVLRGLKTAYKNPPDPKLNASPEFIEELEAYAKKLGAAQVGFAKVPPEWIFHDKGVLYENAIVLTYEMEKERMDMAPSEPTGVMVQESYNSLGIISFKLTKFLRKNGYGAMAGHASGGQILYPPMAQKAGIGWMSMSGLMLTPELGPRVRVGAVFTSIENLPFYEGDEHAWIADYCDVCRLCLKKCPGGAITGEPIYHPENNTYTSIDNEKCFPWFIDAYGCSVCCKVCPFSKPGHVDKIKDRFMKTREVLTEQEVANLEG